MKRTVNSEMLDKWISRDDGRLSQVMQDSGLSFYTIDRMRRGKYLSEPGKSTRNAICMATKLKEDELFPVTAGESQAS